VHGVTFALYENLSPGYGYTAIAVALLAGLNPLWVIATGIFFGALEAGASALQRDAGIPVTIASVIEAFDHPHRSRCRKHTKSSVSSVEYREQ
jgi:simple sugar transport system permease protein